MKKAYVALLHLYPSSHRALFAPEMSLVFERAAEEHRGRGRLAFLRFAVAEFLGILFGAGREWFVTCTRPSAREQALRAAAEQSGLPYEVVRAQQQTDLCVKHMVNAIASHDFTKARFFSEAERRSRENLRALRQKYNIAE